MNRYTQLVPKGALRLNLLLLTLFVCKVSTWGQTGSNFSELSIEQLAQLPIVETSKSDYQLFDAPNGSFVFNSEAIENLPVDSIPELLRYAPGTHIMRASNGAWGLGIRGMNSRFLGRSLYTVDEQTQYGTIFNGLFGSDHDLLLDDVAAVEVVFGPGGTLWGTNAANGRVNVLLKSVFETEGTALKTRIGTKNRSADARHGWLINENSGARVWAKKSDRKSPTDSYDETWKSDRAGIRYEYRPGSKDLLSVSAETYNSELGTARDLLDPNTGVPYLIQGPEDQSGFGAQIKWTRQENPDNASSFRAWINSTEFRSLYADYDLELLGMELRRFYSPSESHKFVFAAGMASDGQTLIDSDEATFIDDYSKRTTNGHFGGEYTFKPDPDALEFNLGLSGSYDSQSDSVATLPSLRLFASPTENSRAWISYSSSSRAMPTGIGALSEFQQGYLQARPISIPTPGGIIEFDTHRVNIVWQDSLVENERLDALEFGYRINQANGGSLSVTAFVNQYQNVFGLRDFKLTPIMAEVSPYILNEVTLENIADGYSTGLEISKNWFISDNQDFIFNYSYITESFDAFDSFQSNIDRMPVLQRDMASLNNNVPHHHASLWYAYSLDEWRFDLGLRYNSQFDGQRSRQGESLQSDIRLSWKNQQGLKISIVGRNLLSPETDETVLKTYIGRGSEVPREAYLEADLQF